MCLGMLGWTLGLFLILESLLLLSSTPVPAGDVSPWHTEGFGKLGLCPAAGTRLRTEVAKAGNAALSPPGRAGGSKARKGNGSEGTPKDRSDSAAGTAPRARPAHFQAETFTCSSSRAAPAQPR